MASAGSTDQCIEAAWSYGFYGDAARECRCTLDRIDIHIETPAVAYKELRGRDEGTGPAEIRARVMGARALRARRFG